MQILKREDIDKAGVTTAAELMKTLSANTAPLSDGASITDGYASTFGGNKRWPNDLAARINTAGMTVGVLNQGIAGNKLLSDGSGPSAQNRFQRDVY